jgi:hypothetical protein
MKRLSDFKNGTHYLYKGYKIFLDNRKGGERKYSYIKDGGYSETNRFGYARTLDLAKTWINIALNR